ncbi:MAG: hypothetical protein QHG99_04425 [Methanomicrobiales archaeon]|nr:hypothetical protein [Methanomicrobiales archaeon]
MAQGTPQGIEELPEGGSQFYSLQDAVTALQWYTENENIDISSLIIYSIHGSYTNIEGRAEEWLFGVEAGGDPYIIIFSDGEWTKNRWGERFETKSINIDEIIPPEDLFRNNRDKIMELMNGTGTDTIVLDIVDDKAIIAAISGEGFRQLILNAYTGEVIVSDV